MRGLQEFRQGVEGGQATGRCPLGTSVTHTTKTQAGWSWQYAKSVSSGRTSRFEYEAREPLTDVLYGQTKGTASSCTYDGEDQVAGPWGGATTSFILYADLKHYVAGVETTKTYDVHVGCPGIPPYDYPVNYIPLDASNTRAGHLATPGSKTIRGTYPAPGFPSLTFDWRFEAQVP